MKNKPVQSVSDENNSTPRVANDLSVRQMARLLKKLCLKENDILLIRKSTFNDDRVLASIQKGIERMNFRNILAIVVDDFDDLNNLNQQDMNKHGWYHLSQINKLTNRIKRP